MSRRIAFHHIITVVILVWLLTGLSGCFGGGNGPQPGAPLTIILKSLNTLQYGSTVPIQIKVDSQTATKAVLGFLYKVEGEEFVNMTSAPGRPNPTAYGQVVIPKGSTTFIFWWHAVADLPIGEKTGNVFVKAWLLTEYSSVVAAVSTNLTFDYTDILGGVLPPYVAGGALPPGMCGNHYDETLFLEGGYPPFVWTLLPDGAALPWYLELTHDGHITGDIPVGYGPLMLEFIAKAVDASPYGQRESSGVFNLYIDCDVSGQCAPPPEILFTALPDAKVSEAYFYEMKAAGGEGALAWEIQEGALPSGLTFEDGIIMGAPNVGTVNEYPLKIQVCDSCPIGIQCDTVEVVLVVTGEEFECDPAPVITTFSIPGAIEKIPYSQQLDHAGGHGSVTWTMVDGALPAGVQFTSGGLITGTPAIGTAGASGKNYNFTVELCDSCPIGPQCATKDFLLAVAPAAAPCAPPPVITTTSPIDPAAEGVEYNFQFLASGGDGVKIWTLISVLPTGLLLNPENGTISGTPEAGTAGDYQVEVEVADSCSVGPQTDTGTFDFHVAEPCGPPPTIVQNTMVPATVGVEYNATFTANDGVPPLSWTQSTSGTDLTTLGLTLDTDGHLHGTPGAGAGGVYNDIGIIVTDSCSTSVQMDEHLYTFTVLGGCADGPVIDSTELPQGAPGYEYNFTLAVSGGEGTLTYELLAPDNNLPTGIDFSDGTLSGTPAALTQGDYQLHFQVCDSCPTPQCNDTTLTLTIGDTCGAGPTITSPALLPDALIDQPYSYQFTATGGEGALTWVAVLGIPPGFNLTSSGLMEGAPTISNVGVYNFNVNVRDSCWLGPQTDNLPCTLNIVADGCMPAPEIQPPIIPPIPAGSGVYVTLTALFGEGDLTWTLLDATPPLPAGVVFLPEGFIVGTTDITDGGTYKLDIQVCDSCTDPGAQCDTILDLELEVTTASGCGAGAPAISDLTIPTPTADGSHYSHTMSATGGDGSLIWFARGLPTTITMNPTTGELSGKVDPVDAGTYHVVVSVIDQCMPIPQADSIYVVWNIS